MKSERFHLKTKPNSDLF